MRWLGLLLIAFCLNAYSYEITCFSAKKRVYHGYGYDFHYADDYIAFREYKSGNFIIISADCIIMREFEGGKIYAFDKRQASQV